MQDFIFGADIADIRMDDETILIQFKKNHDLKTNQQILPILTALMTSKFRDVDKQLILNHIENHINVFYYMNKDILIKLIHYIAGPKLLTTLKSLKIRVTKKIPKDLWIPSDDVKEIYELRYTAILLNYIDYFINLLS